MARKESSWNHQRGKIIVRFVQTDRRIICFEDHSFFHEAFAGLQTVPWLPQADFSCLAWISKGLRWFCFKPLRFPTTCQGLRRRSQIESWPECCVSWKSCLRWTSGMRQRFSSFSVIFGLSWGSGWLTMLEAGWNRLQLIMPYILRPYIMGWAYGVSGGGSLTRSPCCLMFGCSVIFIFVFHDGDLSNIWGVFENSSRCPNIFHVLTTYTSGPRD